MVPATADSPTPQPPSRHPLVLAGLGALAVAVVAVVVLLVTSGDDGDGTSADESAGEALGSAIGGTTTVPSNVGTAVQETTATPATTGPHPDLPPVTIPTESTPPTTIPGSEPASVPGGDGDLPLFAHLVVDLEPGGYQDFAVYLREDQEFQLLSLADDGIMTDIEVFAPDGSSEGSWQGGEPGVVNGLEWYAPDEQLPATGTYVIRVVHTGGNADRFVLAFFGDA